ncbi:MAG: hypothetical protein BM556_06860 [Bacteriovorax sp. MedPE-SWde]|nr:MAG: hypothetical protein BM556_06860 [Bacteriovorax sp. MedPE-SWde]
MHTSGEFDFLAQETARLVDTLSDSEFEREFFLAPEDNIDAEQVDDLLDSDLNEEALDYPNAPGIVYNICKSGTTFSLRGIVTDSIEDTFDTITMGDQSSLRHLKVDESDLDSILFQEFQSIDQAEIVYDQLFNKRYPIEEDLLCNISDPGFSWWYGKTEDGFRINFKSHKLSGAGERLKLGPIGDVVVSCLRFNRLKDHFKQYIPISEIVISEKQFVLKSSDTSHPILTELMRLFEEGEISDDSILLCELSLTEVLFLKELAAVRKFWLLIERKLAQNTKMLN